MGIKAQSLTVATSAVSVAVAMLTVLVGTALSTVPTVVTAATEAVGGGGAKAVGGVQ